MTVNTPRPRASFAERAAHDFAYYDRRVTDAAVDLAKFVASGYALDHDYIETRLAMYRNAVADRDRAIGRALDEHVAAIGRAAAVDADSTRANGGERRSFAMCNVCGFTNDTHSRGCVNYA